ncbi:unnamed protein product [Adineta steineri]|uniref:Uncharacterized protein n=1 Tax=Adineta steineri TaxID=433720 RepID=A0A814VLP5_9BILA|nr:unnamed protein product [Adineta steineri]CAF4296463.1 unnamed protein product [Adineta steineri]
MNELSQQSNNQSLIPVHVQLEYQNLTDADIQHVIDEQITEKHCTSLNLSGNQITHKGVTMLANILKNNKVKYLLRLNYTVY